MSSEKLVGCVNERRKVFSTYGTGQNEHRAKNKNKKITNLNSCPKLYIIIN
jgi:hypothetical protein